jgi:hypothetical protein
MASGLQIGSPIGPSKPFTSFGDPSTFTSAATTQASDYDKIMQQYADLAKSYSTSPITAGTVSPSSVSTPGGVSPSSVSYSSVAPQTAKYEQSGDVTSSLGKLSDLATTGGYSEADKSDIRARDISPIRSIYANAQQNAERSKALGGGYSPNFGAVTAQMSRDEANKIGDVTTSANAGIAQNVASNRIAAAAPYASASASANAAKTASDQHNADIINQINEMNSQGALSASSTNASNSLNAGEFNTSTEAAIAEANANRATTTGEFNVQAALDAAKTNRSGALGAIEGQRSLYGTTPALTNTFGNQVMQAGQLGQGQQNINLNKQRSIFGMAGG